MIRSRRVVPGRARQDGDPPVRVESEDLGHRQAGVVQAVVAVDECCELGRRQDLEVGDPTVGAGQADHGSLGRAVGHDVDGRTGADDGGDEVVGPTGGHGVDEPDDHRVEGPAPHRRHQAVLVGDDRDRSGEGATGVRCGEQGLGPSMTVGPGDVGAVADDEVAPRAVLDLRRRQAVEVATRRRDRRADDVARPRTREVRHRRQGRVVDVHARMVGNRDELPVRRP